LPAPASTTTRALDEIVWAVDPRQDTLESFTGYLCSFAQEVLANAGVKCRFDLPDSLPATALSSKARHHIFLAFKEALHNVIRHASATEVRIRLAVGEKETELEIRDNGHGFDTSRTTGRSGGGHGFRNMRDRLKTVGGRCEMTSQANAGTQICFIWKAES
jgi:signal transduction histidine kinase